MKVEDPRQDRKDSISPPVLKPGMLTPGWCRAGHSSAAPGPRGAGRTPGARPSLGQGRGCGRPTVPSTCQQAPTPEKAQGPCLMAGPETSMSQVKTGPCRVGARPGHPAAQPLLRTQHSPSGGGPPAAGLQLQQLREGVPQGLQVSHHHRSPPPPLCLAFLLRQLYGFNL